MNTPSDQSAHLSLLREVHRCFSSAGTADDIGTALPWFTLIRRSAPTPTGRGMLQPSMCLIVQGHKEMLVGDRVLHYGPGQYVQTGVAMPVAGRIIHATATEPYYGLRVDLDPREIAAFMLEMDLPSLSEGGDGSIVTVHSASEALTDAFLRLLRLFERPGDLPVLGRLIKQEIMYHLLTGPGGLSLRRAVAGGHQEQAVSRAISWIREHYDEPLRIAKLAQVVHLSPSVLHRRFKTATIMSPLQYQKQVRLLEARRRLMSGDQEAATVAYQVGYESPSQFSREYRRLFGATPLQDAQQLRSHALDP
ncbi:MAG: AraC family transcriptional regulator [Alphaproteobacteria bacterium]|nr:MAG: AraC family transcriptional regulator [Alphaproteobacteria bacterium]